MGEIEPRAMLEYAREHSSAFSEDPEPYQGPTEIWAGTFHGHHDGTSVTVTATLDDRHPLPYGWTCPACGVGQRFPDEQGVWGSARRHVHPPFWRTWARRIPALRRIVQSTPRLIEAR